MAPIDVAAEVRAALDAGQPIVALESALITHGFAYPANVAITRRMAAAIRERGAIPAVVGVWKGRPTVGLSEAQVEAMASATAVKVSVRDLPLTARRPIHGGTTVAATSLLAHRVGIRVFATGGSAASIAATRRMSPPTCPSWPRRRSSSSARGPSRSSICSAP